MSSTLETEKNKTKSEILKNHCGKNGLKVDRYFTQKGVDPFHGIQFEKRTSKISNPDGSTVFEMNDVEVPKSWSQVSTDIMAQKYFRKRGVPQYDKNGYLKKDKDGNIITGSENSAKQVANRLAKTWRHWGEEGKYFENKEDADAFEDDLVYMLINQMAAPNSPQWFNTGLHHAYGITGSAQGHYYVDPKTKKITKSKDSYTRPQPHACFIQSVKDDMVNEGGIFDLVTREARLFKYGSGTGTNFSNIRGRGESLSGGGQSSGLMSFLQVFDRAAGAIKSGGTTRRAAKMVCLDIDHPEIEEFIDWKVIEEQKVAALHAGSYICYKHLRKIMECAEKNGINPDNNRDLKHLIIKAKNDHIPLNYIKRVLMLLEHGMKPEEFNFRTYDMDFRSEAYLTVSGQNSNNSIRLSNKFMQAVENDEEWNLMGRVENKPTKTLKANDLWEKLCYAAWFSADPGVQYDSTINEWHTCPENGRINASNPCSEYMFLDNTACNLASLNLIKFFNAEKQSFDIDGYKHAIRLWTIVLEISVYMAQFPAKEIAELSFDFRTLGLGYANLGTLLMQLGLPYDSPEALAMCGSLTSILTGESYATSAEMAKCLGVFEKYEKNKNHMLKVIRNHRRAVYNAAKEDYEDLTISPQGIQTQYAPPNLLESARECWDRALSFGENFGYRNAQVTVLAPTGTIGLLMDCDTTGIEPDFALVKFKKLVGGGYLKIANQSIEPALKKLGYQKNEIEDIIDYCKGKATLNGCPYITPENLGKKGFTTEKVLAIEAQLHAVFELKFAFNKWALGEDFCKEVLKFTDAELNNPNFNMLKSLGFTEEEIETANEYVCGRMTIEGSPYLKKEHYSVFDCANRCGKKGKRYIPYKAHIRMLAAAQPFITGSISKTINLPEEATVDSIKEAYTLSWKLMLKANALYRDGSKLSQPLNTSSMDDSYAKLFSFDNEEDIDETVTPQMIQKVIEKVVQKPMRRRLPAERHSITHKFSIAGYEGYLTIGLYEDGSPGELFIKISKEGSTLSGIMDALALSISLNLQYGVPLEVLIQKFTHTRFDPAGITGNKEIPMVKSIIDYLGRWLALKFMDQNTAKKYHNSDLVEKSYLEGTNSTKSYTSILSITEEAEKIAQNIMMEKETEKYVETISVTKSISVDEHRDISHWNKSDFDKEQAKMAVQLNNEDAPICHGCGAVMVRNGTCYKCLDCGETSGCS